MWDHVVATYNGNGLVSGMKIYVDGVVQALTTLSNNLASNTIQNTADVRIGAATGQAGDYLFGQIDDVRIYNTVLGQANVTALYNYDATQKYRICRRQLLGQPGLHDVVRLRHDRPGHTGAGDDGASEQLHHQRHGRGWRRLGHVLGQDLANPSAFSFTNQTGLAASTVTSSNIVQITGIGAGCTWPISIAGNSATYRICADATCSANPAYVSTAGTLTHGQYVQMQMTTSATYNAALTTTLSIGYTPVTDVWSLTVMSPKWVFISSASYTGNFGTPVATAIANADADCAGLATAAGLAGTYKAWIAVTSAVNDPAARFTHAAIPYETVDGVIIANNWAGLIAGLSNGIKRNECNGGVANNAKVWTNVSAAGAATNSRDSSTKNCNSWSNAGGNPEKGNDGVTGSAIATWTASGSANCNTAGAASTASGSEPEA